MKKKNKKTYIKLHPPQTMFLGSIFACFKQNYSVRFFLNSFLNFNHTEH